MQKRWWCQVREGCVSHRATSSRDHARETTTAHSSAGTKASPAETAVASVAGASALRSVSMHACLLIINKELSVSQCMGLACLLACCCLGSWRVLELAFYQLHLMNKLRLGLRFFFFFWSH